MINYNPQLLRRCSPYHYTTLSTTRGKKNLSFKATCNDLRWRLPRYTTRTGQLPCAIFKLHGLESKFIMKHSAKKVQVEKEAKKIHVKHGWKLINHECQPEIEDNMPELTLLHAWVIIQALLYLEWDHLRLLQIAQFLRLWNIPTAVGKFRENWNHRKAIVFSWESANDSGNRVRCKLLKCRIYCLT